MAWNDALETHLYIIWEGRQTKEGRRCLNLTFDGSSREERQKRLPSIAVGTFSMEAKRDLGNVVEKRHQLLQIVLLSR